MSIALVENQVANFKIAIPDNASIVEKTVSSELADYIFKATGAKIETISESSALGTTIYIGHTEFAKTKNPVERRDFLFCIIHFSLFNIHHSLRSTGFFNE